MSDDDDDDDDDDDGSGSSLPSPPDAECAPTESDPAASSILAAVAACRAAEPRFIRGAAATASSPVASADVGRTPPPQRLNRGELERELSDKARVHNFCVMERKLGMFEQRFNASSD